jgi:hypothetical protein
MPPLRLQFEITPQEASQAQSLALRQQLGGGSALATWLILLSVLGAGLAALYFMIEPGQRALWIGIFVAIWIAVFALTQLKKKPPPETNTVEITPQRLRLLVAGTELDHSWSAFSQLLESDTLFVLVDRSKTVLFTLPKRAFPDQPSQDWFRSLVDAALAHSPEPQVPPQDLRTDSRPGLTLRFRYTYLDYLDYTLAGWFTRGVMLGAVAMIIYVVIHARRNPVPNPVHSNTTVFLMMSPFFLLLICMYPAVTSLKYWFAARKQLTDQAVTFDDDGLTMTEPTGDTRLAWGNLRFYKETRRLFILWSSPRVPSLMLPKRALNSEADLHELRALLGKHLVRSTWLIG